MDLPDCCANEAQRTLRHHHDIATCDVCDSLLLAYGDERTFKLTIDELDERCANFSTGSVAGLHVIAKRK